MNLAGYWTWPRDYANKQCHKVWWWSIEKYTSYIEDEVYLDNFWQIKGHNAKVLHGIWLVIRLGQEIMLTNYVTKFDDDPLKNIRSYRADKVNFVQFCLIQEP